MHAEFWKQRWQQGHTAFHRTAVQPLLQQHWPTLALPAGSQVLVPLCGKSLDMHWLAARGHRVLGVELSEQAVAQFFDEAGLQPQRHRSASGEHYRAGAIELIVGDAFALAPELLAGCDAVYDRAALVALPDALRRRYLDQVYARLPVGCRGLLITMEYPQPQYAGPPFAVAPDEVQALFSDAFAITPLARHDILAEEPRMAAAGLTSLWSAVYRLQRTP